ncbi:hypothetical protein B0J13DRAFT_524489 [Dactylonectria estremocensis]|uniref:Uncharacterized protein n=1 Tax=Dactylonectria estremocensis TaxID=1079267 RepID=A0A9P9EWV8_9HYPO|nr:hypothetical protein B0J13DRAFT_524489 [Dactylonectria estremocensis]
MKRLLKVFEPEKQRQSVGFSCGERLSSSFVQGRTCIATGQETAEPRYLQRGRELCRVAFFKANLPTQGLNLCFSRFVFIITVAAFAFTISGVFAGWEAVRIAKDTTALDRMVDRLWLIGERLWLVYEALIWANRLLLVNFCTAPAVRILSHGDRPQSDANKCSILGRTSTTHFALQFYWTKPDGCLVDLAFQLDPLNFNRSLLSPDAADPVPLENGLLSTPGGLATMLLAVITGPLLLGALLIL